MALNEHPFVDPLAPVRMVPYEARNFTDPVGFYIRMDMPGVSKDTLQVRSRPLDEDQYRLTFEGVVPELWDNGPESKRIYRFSVRLNRDPATIRIVDCMRNGCLRWYFPDTVGSLDAPYPPIAVTEFKGWGIIHPCEDAMLTEDPDMKFNRANQSQSVHAADCECKCDRQRYYRFEYRPYEIGVIFNHKEFCDGCFYCPEDKETLLVSPPAASYINPFLVHGNQGVCESKFFDEGSETYVLLRLDVPDLDECAIMANHENFNVHGLEDHRLRDNLVIAGKDLINRVEYDEVPRRYLCCVTVECSCCRLECRPNEWTLENGVFMAALYKKKKAP